MPITLGPFGGPITAIDAEAINPVNSSDELNVIHQDGRLRPRNGYRNLDGIPTNWVGIYGLDYAQGYNSSNALVEEFISAERLSTYAASKSRFFSRHVTTGAETEIKNGVTSVSVTNTGFWRTFTWRDVAYICNPNETTTAAVYRHAIGDATSLTAMIAPADPTTALTYRIDLASGGSLQYATMDWLGTAAGDITATGNVRTADVAVDSTGVMTLFHENDQASGSFEIDLNAITAGVQDWTYNDCFAFTLTPKTPSAFDIDPASIRVTFTNNDGSPKTLIPNRIKAINLGNVSQVVTGGDNSGPSSPVYAVRVQFDNKTRADWDNIKKVKVAYSYTKAQETQSLNGLRVSVITLGCCVLAKASNPTATGSADAVMTKDIMRFGYSQFSSAIGSAGMESGIGGSVDIPIDMIQGQTPFVGHDPLGCWITFTLPGASGDANVDNYRLHWLDDEGRWRRIMTQVDGTTTYVLRQGYSELLALTQYTPNPFTQAGCITGFPFRGWVIWLYQGGYQNVKHSRIGLPEQQYSIYDSPTDPNRGAVFSMADNFGDEPFGGAQCDEAAMIVGNQGVYAQLGIRPTEMDPPKKLAGSFGAPNAYAFTRIQFGGQAAMAVLSKDGEGIYAYIVKSNFDGNSGFEAIELTKGIRGSIRDFLMTPQSLTDLSTARLVYEPNTDALWLIVGVRAIVLRKASLATGEREWEFYRFGIDSSETISMVAASLRTRIKWMRSHGKFDEVEWNATTLAYITGSLKDGGNTMPSAYWESKNFAGDRRRLLWIYMERETGTDTPTVTVTSTEGTNTYTFASGKKYVKGKIAQIGQEHKYKITLSETSGYIKKIEIDESVAIGKRRRVA